MSTNPLKQLSELGQSIWYDYIRRDLYEGTELKRMIEEDGLGGMTSNPSIFQKAIANSDLYDEDIQRLVGQHKAPATIFEKLAVVDVQHAADAFRPVYDAQNGNDGFVSIEVGPHLAHDTQGTIDEARRLWNECDRPNVMIKIPGTKAGLPAIRTCLGEGININITLLFSVERYMEVMEAYAGALEDRLTAGKPIDKVRSVASFFVSRVDSNTDKQLDAIAKDKSRSEDDRRLARELRGKLAIANAKLAYEEFEKFIATDRYKKLEKQGAALQRPLWASTSTKDPAYPDIYYVDTLVAEHTVNTLPPETFDAYRDHGKPAIRIKDDMDDAHAVFTQLKALKVSVADITQELEDEGVKKFADAYDGLLATIDEKLKALNVA